MDGAAAREPRLEDRIGEQIDAAPVRNPDRRCARFERIGNLVEDRAPEPIEGRRPSWREAEDSVHQAERIESVCWSHGFHAFVEEASGEARRALDAAQAAVEIGEGSGSPHALAVALAALGIAHTLSGEWESAIETCDRSLTIMREKGVAREGEAYGLATLARAHLGRGDVTRAQALADEAAALARRQDTPVYLCAANLARARAFTARDGVRAAGEVEAILTEAERLAAETGARVYLPEIHVERAELAGLAGDEVTRDHELRAAHRLFTEMGATARADEVTRKLEGQSLSRTAARNDGLGDRSGTRRDRQGRDQGD